MGATMATEPAPVGGGAAACVAAAFLRNCGSIVAFGVRLSATSDPPATAGGSVWHFSAACKVRGYTSGSCSTIRFVRSNLLLLTFFCSCFAWGQNAPSETKNEQNPPVKVNVLNVCTPSADEQQELKAALARLPKSPAFDADYEISRGVSTIEGGARSKYVRLRREVKGESPLATVQYSLSVDSENTIETLVFRGRDVKDLLALSIEDKLSSSASKPSAVLDADTPASRVRVERAGKSTVALARCENVDQSKYDAIFSQASSILSDYRRVLRLKSMLASDIAWLSAGSSATHSSKAGAPDAACSH